MTAKETGNKNQKKNKRRGCLWLLLALSILLIAAAVGGGYAGYLYFSYDLPKLNKLSDYHPKTVSRFYSDDGTVIAEYYEERREVVPLSRMPRHLVNAFVAAEDQTFFDHPGISVKSIIRSAIKNFQAGRIVQGGSTITQQVCRSFLLSREKKYARKIREAILAYRIDKKFSKNEILYLFLNQIYMGEGAYGVEAAAQAHFGKSVEDLTLAESALMAGLLPAPSRYSPRTNPASARERQIYVLNRMVDVGYITAQEAQEAAREKVAIMPRRLGHLKLAPYFCDHVRRLIEEKYGSTVLLEGGLKVYTSLNLGAQEAARLSMEKGLRDLDKREGYRGPLKRIDPAKIPEFIKELEKEAAPLSLEPGMVLAGVVEKVSPQRAQVHLGPARGFIGLKEMRWARKPNPEVYWYAGGIRSVDQALAGGDVVLAKLLEKTESGDWKLALEQIPAAQSALVCMAAATGQVKAMVGGRDYRDSQFNRATQALRQPGSAFKTFVYAAAFDKDYTPSSIVIDSPETYRLRGTDQIWKPRNFKNRFYGPTTLRVALEHSRNVVAVKLLKEIGVEYVVDYAKKLGITADLTPNLSLALGSNEVTVLEMVRAYSVFCNLGLKTEPMFYTRVEDRNGAIIEEPGISQELVLDPATAYLVSHILEGAVQHGTGKMVLPLGRPAAGKTGTTNDLRDAWFAGYTPDFVTVVWTGHDDHSSMGRGETGARAAIPIWLEFMTAVCADLPVRSFEAPEGVVFARVDRLTGLLAGPDSKDVVMEAYKPGTSPDRSALQGPQKTNADLLKQDF